VVEGIMGLGFSSDRAVIQNMGIVLNKVVTDKNVFQIYDEERHKNILDVTVLVVDM
jgi:hypothetical protein